ncbi:MAG: DUF975 family protein [Lachnospiraceae bacterium]|nr:DUF975 family protein [Lachnospiraceae bacterium]
MWTRKELKCEARKKNIRNYWNCITVCLVMAVLVGKYPINIETLQIFHNAADRIHIESVQEVEKLLEKEHERWIKADVKKRMTAAYIGTLLISVISSAGSFICMALRMFHNMGSSGTSVEVMILSILAGCTFMTVFVVNVLMIGEARFFLENRRYQNTHLFRIFFLFRYGILKNPIWVMFRYTIYILLWSLTIVGGMVKSYEYSMVPFLLAENPKIDGKAAFALSRQMMKGQKWNCFLLDLSFIGWGLMGIFTIGISALFWSFGYRMAVRAELYAVLRKNAIEEEMEYYELCNDPYLIE